MWRCRNPSELIQLTRAAIHWKLDSLRQGMGILSVGFVMALGKSLEFTFFDLQYQKAHTIIPPDPSLTVLSWKGTTRIKSSSWLLTGPPKN